MIIIIIIVIIMLTTIMILEMIVEADRHTYRSMKPLEQVCGDLNHFRV